MMDYDETTLTDSSDDSVEYLQTVLNVAQSKLNDFMVRSVTDEASFIQQTNKIKKSNEKYQLRIKELELENKELQAELNQFEEVLISENTKKNQNEKNQDLSPKANDSRSQITMKVE